VYEFHRDGFTCLVFDRELPAFANEIEVKDLQNNAQKCKIKDKEHNEETKLHRRHSSAVMVTNVMIIIYVEQNVRARNRTTTE